MSDRILTLAALILAAVAVWQLERPRAGLEIASFRVGETPVTSYEQPGADGPVVVIAHGFAGSRQLMQSYALALAQAGYRVVSFDFQGHGRNPVPMSGDVNAVDGTTRLLVDQTLEVTEDVAGDAPVAFLGHSMATDVIIRAAIERGETPVVALSAFSGAVTETAPRDLLMIAGEWEGRLRDFGLEAVRMVDPEAGEGEVVTQDGLRRAALVAPNTEHVSILYSATAIAAARDWLDTWSGRASGGPVPQLGGWLLALLAALVILTRPLSRLLPARPTPPDGLGTPGFLLAVAAPALVAPLLAPLLEPETLPVLVADYLMVHLALYGLVQGAVLWWLGARPGPLAPLGTVALLAWGLGAFGLALDRYGANFVPDAARLGIIAVLALGAVPFMLADAVLTRGAALWRRVVARAGFLASLGGAVALDFEGLFFLLLIAPVILLFFLTFGLMGRWVARRSGPVAAGIGLGLILAWALGVSFPLFDTGGA